MIVERLRAAGCVWAEDEANLLLAAAAECDSLDALVGRRVAGEPLEQVLGWAGFCGLRLRVRPGVFVPRRRTEFLVRTAARLSPPTPVVLDLCAGTGALGAAFASMVALGELHVTDVDPEAVACARDNVPVGTELYEGDLYAPLPALLRGRVDVLLANAPYVPSGELATLPPEAREHEPASALDGGADGLDLHRRIVAGAPHWLAPGGAVFIEVSEAQRPAACALMIAAGLAPSVALDRDLGATVVVGRRRADDVLLLRSASTGR